MQDLRYRIGRKLPMLIALYLIQALSFSTVYSAIISTDFSSQTKSSSVSNYSDSEISKDLITQTRFLLKKISLSLIHTHQNLFNRSTFNVTTSTLGLTMPNFTKSNIDVLEQHTNNNFSQIGRAHV